MTGERATVRRTHVKRRPLVTGAAEPELFLEIRAYGQNHSGPTTTQPRLRQLYGRE
jgi:hypothetical protein